MTRPVQRRVPLPLVDQMSLKDSSTLGKADYRGEKLKDIRTNNETEVSDDMLSCDGRDAHKKRDTHVVALRPK